MPFRARRPASVSQNAMHACVRQQQCCMLCRTVVGPVLTGEEQNRGSEIYVQQQSFARHVRRRRQFAPDRDASEGH